MNTRSDAIRLVLKQYTSVVRVHLSAGEIINKAIIVKRAADTQALGEVLASCYVATVVREPTHELYAVQLALLVETTRRDDLDQALSDLAADWKDGWSYACSARYGPVRLSPTLVPPR